ncbi:MAG: hypothetical protein IK120_02375, partial [Muribaculaceae bacterium]|nr:hypothetical protein [Muribaculaceae bacterium]
VSIDEGAGNDLISLSSAAKNNLIVYRAGDGSDTIYGFNADDTLRIGDGTNTYSDTVSGDDLIVTVGEGSITLRGAASLSTVNINGKKVNSDKPYDSAVIIDGKKITLTEDYITPNFNVADYGELLMTIDATAVVRDLNIKANDLANYIKGSEQNDTIEGGGAADTINGSAGNDSIIGGSGNDLLFGDDDDDTLSGGEDNDTLTGGAGDDVFIYTAGKDVIEDYTPEEDRIHIAEGKITSSVISGSDVTFTIDSKSKLKLTVKDGKYKAITFVDANDKETISVPGAATVNKSNYTAPTTAEYIDGTAWKKNATITGNTSNNTILGSVSYNNTIYGGDGNDSIVGGKVKNNLNGGDGNDTLVGSAGNDMLTGNEGADVFIYTAGKDVITDYTEGDDIISLGAATLEDVTATRSGSDGILNIGTGTLTISKAKGKTVKIMDKDGKDTLIAFSPNVTLTNANSSLFSADEGDEQIDASARTIKIQIKGNELDNTILGSTKGDTIYGEV